MLTASQFDKLSVPIMDLYEAYQTEVIKDISRRISKMDFATETAAWQMQRIIESGAVYENALEEIARLTGKSKNTVAGLFKQAGVQSMKFDDKIYKAAGLDPLPLKASPAMLDVLVAGVAKTNGVMSNMTLTTAMSGQEAFIQAADMAYMHVVNGTMSYDEAIRQAIKKVANEGLKVIQYNGRRDQIDVAMRRTVLTGSAQTTAQLQLERVQEMGVSLVQTTAHQGSRPEHEDWQGQVFCIDGSNPDYEDFVEVTGYGEADGLGGVNCRHSFFPFFEGISENAYEPDYLEEMNDATVEYNGEEFSQYEASQQQRSIEREIRSAKREAEALSAAGLNNTAEISKVRDLQGQMRDFTKQTDLPRQPAREGGKTPRMVRPTAEIINSKVNGKVVTRDIGDSATTDFAAKGAKPLDQFEKTIYKNKIETAGLIEPKSGLVVMEKVGGENCVQFSSKDVREMKGMSLTHNHPSGSSFSPDDIKMLQTTGLKEIRVATSRRSYTLTVPDTLTDDSWRKADPWKWADKQLEKFNTEIKQTLAESPYTNIDYKKYDDLMWREFAEKYGLEYHRKIRLDWS